MADHPPAGRTIEVPLARMGRWLAGVADRHGQWQAVGGGTGVDASAWLITAPDGFRAIVHEPVWRPVIHPTPLGSLTDLSALAPHFGAILIRRAGYAVGLFHGTELVERKVGSRHIHGRTAAGGWSQQRYARRRANQADEIVDAAARASTQILGADGGTGRVDAPGRPHAADRSRDPLPASAVPPSPVPPAFLVTGGDRPLLAAVLEQLAPPLAALPGVLHLGIGTPDAKVLAEVPDRVLAVRIDLP